MFSLKNIVTRLHKRLGWELSLIALIFTSVAVHAAIQSFDQVKATKLTVDNVIVDGNAVSLAGGTGTITMSPAVKIDDVTIDNSSISSALGALTLSPAIVVDNILFNDSSLSSSQTITLSPSLVVDNILFNDSSLSSSRTITLSPAVVVDSVLIDNSSISSSMTLSLSSLVVEGTTASQVPLLDANKKFYSSATLPKVNGGSAQDNSGLTFPNAGVIITEGSTSTLTNKTLTAPTITIPTVTGGSYSTPTLSSAVSTNPAITGGTITTATISGSGLIANSLTLSPTEFGHIDGGTSNFQTQIDAITAGSFLPTMVTISTATTSLLTDLNDQVAIVEGTGTAIVVTLYTAVGNGGQKVTVKANKSDNVLSVDANGSQTIDGALTVTLTGGSDSLSLISDGANWKSLSRISRHSRAYSFSVNCDSAADTLTDVESIVFGDPSNISTGSCTITLDPGVFIDTPRCIGSIEDGSVAARILGVEAASATSVVIDCVDDSAGDCSVYNAAIICIGR